jgi:hypothetical protein
VFVIGAVRRVDLAKEMPVTLENETARVAKRRGRPAVFTPHVGVSGELRS